MAVIQLAPPLDDGSGTYGTQSDESLVPFVLVGYVDVPGQAVVAYEDTTNALLGSTTASLSPQPSGAYAGWYQFSIMVNGWAASSGAVVPAAQVTASAGGISLKGVLSLPAAAATTSAGGISAGSAVLVPGYAATAFTAAAGIKLVATKGMPAASATASAGGMGIGLKAPAASVTASAGGISISGGDSTAPVISSFAVPSTDADTSLTGVSAGATDNVGVTGWTIKDVAGGAAAPTATAGECSQTTGISGGALSSSSLTHTVGGTGARDCYLFVKDAAGNVTRSSVSTVTVSAGAGPQVPNDPSFEAAGAFPASGSPGTWFKLVSSNGGAGSASADVTRYASNAIDGSNVARLFGEVVAFQDMEQEGYYFTDPAQYGYAGLAYEWTKAQVDAMGATPITFTMRYSTFLGYVAIWLEVQAYNSGGSPLLNTASGIAARALVATVPPGHNVSGLADTAIEVPSPSPATNYTISTTLKAFLQSKGVNWTNVTTVRLSVWAGATGAGGESLEDPFSYPVDVYVDNFR